MDVELYVYDISRGIARQWSRHLLGFQLDAVYHTSLVFGDVEYFYGAGVQTSFPGSTHHGRPIEVIYLGQTELPLATILDYLDSLKTVYTAQAYDLFLHNCNNFTNDFATFLLGKGIPEHITSLPQTVMDTPFGQMLKPELDRTMRGITQAPVASSNVPPSQRPATNGTINNLASNGHSSDSATESSGIVYKPTTVKQLDVLLARAKDRCAVIFFTSATCPPCKLVYPAYDELAASAGNRAVLIKVDLSESYEIGSKYQISATPTFWSFLHGKKENEWKGASEAQLRGNVNLLLQMAYPAHPHTSLRLRNLSSPHKEPVTYARMPPLDKVMAKLDSIGEDPALKALRSFIRQRQESGAIEATLPSLADISDFIVRSLDSLPTDKVFALVDLIRLAMVDSRFSGYFVNDSNETIRKVLDRTVKLKAQCPYQLTITTIHMACNAFTSPLLHVKLLSDSEHSTLLLQLVTSALLDSSHLAIRVAAASLAFNISSSNHHRRLDDQPDILSESNQIELLASLLEALSLERESLEGLRGMLLAIGLLAYKTPNDGELQQVCEAVGAKEIIKEASKVFKELRILGSEVEQVMN